MKHQHGKAEVTGIYLHRTMIIIYTDLDKKTL